MFQELCMETCRADSVGIPNYQAMWALVLWLGCSLPCLAVEPPPLVLSTWLAPPFATPSQDGHVDRLLIEAFARLRQSVVIERKPAERSLQDANDGVTDGEFMRISQIGELYPHLVMVPEPLYQMKIVAFSLSPLPEQPTDWLGLSPYTVGYVVGWKILEENIRQTRGTVPVGTQETLFRMLAAGRFQVAVYGHRFGKAVIERLGLTGIEAEGPPLALKNMYLFLHRRHQALIPALTAVLRQMKADGSYQAILADRPPVVAGD